MAMTEVVMDAVRDSLKPEWDNLAQSMTKSDNCVLGAIRSTYKSSVGDAVEALASVTDALPFTNGPWSQIVKAITEKILTHPMSVSLIAKHSVGSGSDEESRLVREILSNTIWDTPWSDDHEEDITGASRAILRRINELATTWSRDKDINRLAILLFIVAFTYDRD